MHIISDSTLKRAGYTYEPLPGGGFVGRQFSDPCINWRHIDGPLLYTSTGKLHWLTWRERIRFTFGFETVDTLDYKHS